MRPKPDTEGILDRCRECKSYAGFVQGWTGGWRVECTECPNCTDVFKEQFQAMIAWNMEQRGIRPPTGRNDPSA